MNRPLRVCLQGFSAFEKEALASALRLTGGRVPTYLPVEPIGECEYVVADADAPEALAAVVRAGLVEQAVFIGAHPPPDTRGWLTRPIDTGRLLRELDHLVGRDHPGVVASSTASAPAPLAEAWKPLRPPARALLVDDSEIALRFLETRLHRRGLYTERAAGSARALELMAQNAYDFVFLDVELGQGSELDGLALCQQIKRDAHRRQQAEPPVVVIVSAHHAELDRARGTLAGADAYLGKPLDEAALQGVLQRHGAVPRPARAG